MSVYDTLAPSFDRRRMLPEGVPAAIRGALLDALGFRGPCLLDLGCGSGRIGTAFVAAADNYTGVDLSLAMLRAFAARRDLPSGRVASLVQADGEALPFADSSFDAVMLIQVLGNTRGWRRMLDEARRVSRPAGALVIGKTVAPDDGIDARMKQHLAGVLATMGVRPYREQSTGDALSSLHRRASSVQTVVPAVWTASRTPCQFLERHGSGARFSVLPEPIKDAAMRQSREWAIGEFGSVDVVFTEPWRFDLTIFRFQQRMSH